MQEAEKKPSTTESGNFLITLDQHFSKWPVPVRVVLVATSIFIIGLVFSSQEHMFEPYKLAFMFIALIIIVSSAYILVALKIEKELNIYRASLRVVQLGMVVIMVWLNGHLFFIGLTKGNEIDWSWYLISFVTVNTLSLGLIYWINKCMCQNEKLVEQNRHL